MKRGFAETLLGFISILIVSTSSADAQNTSITLSNSCCTNIFYNGFSYTAGFVFSPKTDINVTSLGSVFPDGSNNVHGVTIWDGSQNILASTTVTGSGGDRGFVFSPITPVILTANSTYVIGSTTSTDGVAIDFPAIDGEINYLAEAEENGPDPPDTTPVYPDQSYAGTNVYSANFQFVVLPGTAEFPFAESAPNGGSSGATRSPTIRLAGISPGLT